MTPSEFTASLGRLGLTKEALIAEIEALTGHEVAYSTLWRMETGKRTVNPFLAAYLTLREQNNRRGEDPAGT